MRIKGPIENKWGGGLPPQQISSYKKNREWRLAHLKWADGKTFFNYSPVRNSVIHKKINYDLVNGKTHREDMELVLNPERVKEKFTSSSIQHYPIINSKLNVLNGEESKRIFDFRVVVTNPLALSEREENKRNAILQQLQKLVEDQSQSEEQYAQNIEKMSDYFTYEWQDMREVRANCLLNHYIKEYNMPLMFNYGFKDAETVGEEIYQCDIRGGEPIIERIDPLSIRVWKSGVSNKIEDADVVIIEEYWNPGRIHDTYYDCLTKEDIDYIENGSSNLAQGTTNEVDEIDERAGYINSHMITDIIPSPGYADDNFFFDPFNGLNGVTSSLLPFDTNGNVRVLRMYWKSRRKIKKVKSYDPETGEEKFDFYPENYVINKDKGEEETIYYVNEAWEGTKIGDEVYVNIRPRPIQYNRLSNPSRCHFGIIGSIYNLNNSKPFSLVDMMKPYSYLYDAVHDRLNRLISKNWGKMVRLDLAKVPKGWDVDKWLYFAKHNSILVEDSFKEGSIGAATGKLAGAMNNASNGVVDAELGQSIMAHTQLLEYIKQEMSDVAGISRQREGQISNRETVGGVERATLQSSHITEWLFITHEDVKKRALECFLETAKIALKGRKEKFEYLLSDGSMQIMNIDGDEFAEADYGLVVDNSNGSQELNQKLETLAQAALQNQLVSFSTIMKLYNSTSLIEKQRLVEKDEKAMLERQQQAQQEQAQLQQQQLELQAQQEQAALAQQEEASIRDNETKILVATINANAKANDNMEQEPVYSQEAKDKLAEQMRQFDAKLQLDKDKLSLERKKADRDYEIKQKQLRAKKTTNTSK